MDQRWKLEDKIAKLQIYNDEKLNQNDCEKKEEHTFDLKDFVITEYSFVRYC